MGVVGVEDGWGLGLGGKEEDGLGGFVGGGEVDGEMGEGLGVDFEEAEGGEGGLEGAGWLLGGGGNEVADAHDGGLESLALGGLEHVLFGYGLGADVGVGGVGVDAEGGDVDEAGMFGKAEVDDAVGALDVGGLDGVVGCEVTGVGCTVDDGGDGGWELVGAEGEEVADDGHDACGEFGGEGGACVLVEGFGQASEGMLLVVGTDEAVDKTFFVG